MRKFARLVDDRVMEIFLHDVDPSSLFHESLVWIDISDEPDVVPGWMFNGTSFSPPTRAEVPATVSLQDLQAQVSALAAQLHALATATGSDG